MTTSVNRRRFLFLSGAVTAGLGLAACSGQAATESSSSAGPVSGSATGSATDAVTGNVTFWKVPGLPDEQERAFFGEQISTFTAANPGATVEYTLMPWDSALTQLTAAYTGTSGPEVTYLIIPWLNQFRTAGVLLALEDVAPADRIAALFKGSSESIVNAVRTDDGKTYGVPVLAANFYLAKNDDVWERAGKPAVPTTYEEMVTFAKAMTLDNQGRSMNDPAFDAGNIAVYGFNWPTDPGAQTNYLWNYLWAYGVDYVNEDGTDIGFNNDEGRAALGVLKELLDSGAAAPAALYTDSNVGGEILLSGGVGFGWQIITSKDTFAKYPDANVSVIGIPKGPAGQFVVGGVGYYSVAASADDPAATFAFIEQLLSDANIKSYLSRTLTFPARDVGALDFYDDGSKASKLASEAAATSQYVRLTRQLNYQPEEFIIGRINDYLLGQQSFEDMAQACSQQVQLLYQQAN